MTTTTALLFDLDGTLTDPKLGITRCIQHALRALDAEVPETDALTWCIGPPLLESFTRLLDAQRAPQAVALYRERFGEVGLYENSVYAGIRELLSTLGNQHRLFVASSKPQIYVERILEHFDLSIPFERIFGSELDGTRSDKTSLIAHVLQTCGLDAQRAVMIGDRAHDAIGAGNNGLPCIGALYGYGSRAELFEAGARTFAQQPRDLVHAVEEVHLSRLQ